MHDHILTYPGEGRFLFLSDTHLGAHSRSTDDRIEQEVIRLVDYAEEHDYRLLLLGDIFDYWMEYDTTYPDLGKRVLDRFETYNRRNGATLYITGNHDYWVGPHLRDRGFDLESNFRILEVDRHRILLHHGDGLDQPDLDLPRPKMHRLLRHPAFVTLYQRVLPARWGLPLMRTFSRLSRRLTGDESQKYRQLDRWTRSQLEHHSFTAIICGHDHQPRHRKYPDGEYLNLGSFIEHRTLGCYTNGNLQLVEWNGESKDLKPVSGTV